MGFNEFIASALLLVLSGVGVVLWAIFRKVGDVQVSMAVVVTQEKLNRVQIDDHEDRIRLLEKNPALV